MPEAAIKAQDPPRPQTSIDTYTPTEVTVRFRRWTAWANTAYLRGQEAGFSAREADDMKRRGVPIDIVTVLDRAPATARMVTK